MLCVTEIKAGRLLKYHVSNCVFYVRTFIKDLTKNIPFFTSFSVWEKGTKYSLLGRKNMTKIEFLNFWYYLLPWNIGKSKIYFRASRQTLSTSRVSTSVYFPLTYLFSKTNTLCKMSPYSFQFVKVLLHQNCPIQARDLFCTQYCTFQYEMATIFQGLLFATILRNQYSLSDSLPETVGKQSFQSQKLVWICLHNGPLIKYAWRETSFQSR